jgi:hypothetical protein
MRVGNFESLVDKSHHSTTYQCLNITVNSNIILPPVLYIRKISLFKFTTKVIYLVNNMTKYIVFSMNLESQILFIYKTGVV